MRRSQKSKRVSWASDLNLCQVRVFTSEESPSKVGISSEVPDDNLPPGFEVIQPENLRRVKLSQIPLMKWRCPPRFKINTEWQVVAGEESKENEAQNRREMIVFEAVYPRLSAIPPNPSASSVDVEHSIATDQNVPLVPLKPIEDSLNPHNVDGISAPTMEPDIVAASAAQAALTSFISKIDQRNMIDRDLLMRILSNPKMAQQLIMSHIPSSSAQTTPAIVPLQSSTQNMPPTTTTTTTTTQYIPNLKLLSKNSFEPTNIAINNAEPISAHITKPVLNAPSTATPFYPPRPMPPLIPNSQQPCVAADATPSMTKDVNYYISLIQQHGGEKRDIQHAHQSNQETMGTSQEHLKFTKRSRGVMKPCMYFNSSRGCRNGANCAYQHDMSSQRRVNGFMEVQSAKRVKLNT